jgi:hypothetical protein
MEVSATFELQGVQVTCTGTITKGYLTHDDFMPDEVEVEAAEIGGQDISQWLDLFPQLLTACEDALTNAQSQ